MPTPSNVLRMVPRQSTHWDRNDVIARLSIADIQSIYRELGIKTFKPGGPGNWKCFVPWRDNTVDEAMTIRSKDGVWSDKATGDAGSIFDAVERKGRASGLDASIAWVVEHLGWTMVEPTTGSSRELARIEYVYADSEGLPLYKAVRTDKVTDDGELFKEMRQFCYAGGSWVGRGPTDAEKVPYNLRLLLDPDNTATPVYIVEGEKCAEAAHDLGLLATCFVGGVNNWSDRYAYHFTGREVVILPDNDDPGWGYAEKVAAALSDRAKSLKVVGLNDLGPRSKAHGLDIADWIAKGHTYDELLGLVAVAPAWEPTAAPRMLESLWQLVQHPPEPQSHLIQGVWAPLSFGLIAAGAKSYKGFAITDMMCSLASGHPFLGHPALTIPATQRIVYWMEEGTREDLHRRVLRWCAARKVEPGPWLDNIYVAANKGLRILSPEGIVRLRDEIEAYAPALVVCDTLARVSAGMNENDPKDMGLIIDLMDNIKRDYGCATAYVHHNNKAGGLRGHSSLYAAADCIMELDREKNSNKVKIGFELKAGHMADDVTCELVDDVAGNGALFLTGSCSVAGARRYEPSIRDLLAFLRSQQLTDDGHQWASDPAIRKGVFRDDADLFAVVSGKALLAGLVAVHKPPVGPRGGRIHSGLTITDAGRDHE